jgi:hypothetical protein
MTDLDQDLLKHACVQLGEVARRHVRGGMGPASAARAAIRETKALFPHDWRLAVQGDDDEEDVEVWEVEHKYPVAIARIRAHAPELVKLTSKQRDLLDALDLFPGRAQSFYAPSLRRSLPGLVKRGLAREVNGQCRLTDAGRAACYAARDQDR